MAVSMLRYNHTAKKLLNKEINTSTLKVMLLTNTAAFNAANTQLTQVTNAGAYEVSGNGWTTGGETLDNVGITTVDTNGAMIDADDIDVTATGGDIGPAYKAVIYDDSDADDAPLWFIDFGESKTADEGTPFKIVFNAAGLTRITQAA